ncbi:unnamed protein product [Commensalibacter communis]|uniref:DUF4145 domain-containing protein n=1 Tax=Commensalibacter communis TaxID=2972786 RepID=UPI0022FF8B71|nr:DUF4145 domain-containing protein [Commensalibacter communis]CAI3929263.1 unnamed protein product [Commensalibacter communis]CAI3929990.1 unnamed protein product [Commensalibacter communis]
MVKIFDGGYNWRCPYCNQFNALGENSQVINLKCDVNRDKEGFILPDKHYNKYNKVLNLQITYIVCLNPQCKEFVFKSIVYFDGSDDVIQSWDSLPNSLNVAKIFPDYIPKAILDDYKEACLIQDKSPKASATLSRRCLQGIIRDFWKVKPDTLYKEINQIKDKIGSDLYDAIDAIRQIGNIGAHMEKDINVIIDVDSNEAQILIELIEMLIEEWYVKDHERKERLARITAIGVEKKALKGSK